MFIGNVKPKDIPKYKLGLALGSAYLSAAGTAM